MVRPIFLTTFVVKYYREIKNKSKNMQFNNESANKFEHPFWDFLKASSQTIYFCWPKMNQLHTWTNLYTQSRCEHLQFYTTNAETLTN